MATTPPRPISSLVLAELYESGDARFLDALLDARTDAGRGLKPLLGLVERWKRDGRPWARALRATFVEHAGLRADHRVVFKRLFKQAAADRDHELMARFAVVLDRWVRRRRVKHYAYAAGGYDTVEVLRVTARRRPSIFSPPGTTPRTYYSAFQYDAADRLTRSSDIGANDGYRYVRGTGWTVPARGDDPDVLVTDYAYDAAGHNDAVTDPRGITDKTTHDALGRVTATIEAFVDGTPSADDDRTTLYAYDGNDNVTLLTAVLPGTGQFQKTRYVHGVSAVGTGASGLFSNDLLARVEYPNLTTGEPAPELAETTTYDAAGQAATSTDRRGTVHTYGRDVLGRLTSDTATTLGSGVDGAVRRLGYGYDALGNTSRFSSYSDTLGASLANEVTRTYDSLGRITNETQSMGALSGAVSFAYDDSDDSLPGQPSGDGVLDHGGRLTSMTYPSGRVLTYGYTAGVDSDISRLSYLDDNTSAGHLEDLSYLGLSTTVVRAHPEALTDWSLAMRRTGSGTWADPDTTSTLDRNDGDLYTGLDNHGRVARVRWDATDSLGFYTSERDDFAYGYDANGNRLYRDNKLSDAFDELYHADGSTSGYDKLDRLVEMQRGVLTDADADGTPDTVTTSSRSQSWTLDALGNWDTLQGSTGGTADATQTRTHDKQNGIKTVTKGAATTTVTHSSNGEMILDDRGQAYVYNAWGQLVRVDPSDAAGATPATVYTYDALFRRIGEDADGAGSLPAVHLYYAPSWQLLEERTVTGSSTEPLKAQHVWSPVCVDALVLSDLNRNGDADVTDEGERFYALQDANFNVTALVGDADAAAGFQPGVVERYAYDAYGSPLVLDENWQADVDGHSDVGNRYLFQGGRHDASLLLSHFRFRDLHVSLGRWTRNDPETYISGSNLFQAFASSPQRLVDPLGLAEGDYNFGVAPPGYAGPPDYADNQPPDPDPQPDTDSPSAVQGAIDAGEKLTFKLIFQKGLSVAIGASGKIVGAVGNVLFNPTNIAPDPLYMGSGPDRDRELMERRNGDDLE